MSKNSIMLIPPQLLPIPAVGGGAIETLITHLMDENEIHKELKLVIVSKSSKEAQAHEYRYSKVYYNHDGVIDFKIFPSVAFRFSCYKLHNKIKRKARALGICIKNWNSELYYQDFFFFQCLLIAKKEKVNIVINEGRGDYQNFRLFFQSVGRANLYYHLHSSLEDNLFFRRVIPNSISISKYVKQKWTGKNDVKGKNYTLYNCIDVKQFSARVNLSQLKKLRQSYSIATGDVVVIFCGRLIPEKGVDKLLDAFDWLNQHTTNIKLLLVGSVGFSNSDVSDYSNQIIARADKNPSVIFLGYIPNKEMPLFYQMADIQVVPSVWQEGAGLVAIEGMASGLPLIITDSGGMIEYVTDDCAIKVPIDDNLSEHLAEKILWLSKNKEKAKQMGIAGKERAKAFTKEKYYKDFVKALYQ